MRLTLVFVLLMIGVQTTCGEFVNAADSDVLQQAVDLQVSGQFQEAERLLRGLLNQRTLTPESKARALNELGLMLGAAGRYDEAERAFQQAIRTGKQNAGLPELLIARARMNLAAIYVECGRGKAAREQLQRITDQEGLKKLYSTQWISVQAAVAMVSGDLKTSKELFASHLNLLRSATPVPQTEIATTLNNLGAISLSLRDYDAAVRYLAEAVQEWRSAVGPHHPSLLRTMANLAIAQQGQRDYDAAGATLAECLESVKAQPELATAFVVALYRQYANVLGKLGLKRQAADMRRTAETLRREQIPALPQDTVVDASAFRKR